MKSALLFATLLLPTLASAASKDLGNGFRDLGVAAPISNHRGTVAVTTPDGHNLLLLWLMDHRGGYALLCCDATTGLTAEYPVPFTFTEFDAPYASLLSSQHKFYTHQNSHFIEFDPALRKFTFSHATLPQMAMSMTEDDHGTIWSTSYPAGGLCSYNPTTQTFRDYGSVHHESWQQYNRFIAADDAGFIYFGVGNTASQIVIFDPATGKSTDVLAPGERKKGVAYVHAENDSKVYGQAIHEPNQPWYELHKGVARKLDSHKELPFPERFISGNQALSITTFRDGTSAEADLVTRTLTTYDPTGNGTKKTYPFDYSSDGAIVMGASVSPDHKILGGTAFPMRNFCYDPKTDSLTNRAAHMQWNTVQSQGSHVFVFGYPGGFLLDYNPADPWVPTAKGETTNPQYVLDCTPTIHRPTKLLPLPDGHRLLAAGTPDYGDTGGGLLLFDRSDQSHTLLKDKDLIPDQSTESMVALSDTVVLAGTTTAPGTGGAKRANLAELYTLDTNTQKITWHAPLIEKVQEYTDLAPAPNGLIYGIADSHTFFVLDPKEHKLLHTFDTTKTLGPTAHEQGPRLFIHSPTGATYLLFQKGIAAIDPATYALTLIAQSPLPIEAGGDLLDNRIYFISGSHLCSYQLK